MALDADVLAELRSWVGSSYDADDLEVRYALHGGSVAAVAAEVLRERLADLIASPTKFAVDGDASWDWTGNIKELRSQIAALEAAVAASTPGGVDEIGIAHLARAGARR